MRCVNCISIKLFIKNIFKKWKSRQRGRVFVCICFSEVYCHSFKNQCPFRSNCIWTRSTFLCAFSRVLVAFQYYYFLHSLLIIDYWASSGSQCSDKMYSGDFTVESNWKIRRVEMTRKEAMRGGREIKIISLILLARVSVPANESQQELLAATHRHKFV